MKHHPRLKNSPLGIGLFLFGIIVSLFPAPILADAPVDVRVGIFQNKPVVFQDDDGQPRGLYVDLLREIAEFENWNIQFQMDTWTNCLAKLASGEIDLLTSIAFTRERNEQMDFSGETVCTLWGIVYKDPRSDIQTIFDLNGKRVAVMQKGVFGNEFIQLCKGFNIHCEIIPTPSQHESLNLLKTKRVDAAIFNNAFREVYEASRFADMTSIIFSPLNVVFATQKGKNQELIQSIDAALKDMKADTSSIYYESLKKWLGVIEVREKYIPTWLKQGFGVAGIAVALAFLWVAVLLVKIKERKRAEGILRDSEERFRALSEAAFEGIAITETGRIIEVNDTMRALFGYSAPELLSMSATDLVVPQMRDDVRLKIMSGFEKPYEVDCLRKDGSVFPVEVRAKIFTHKGRMVRVAAIRDITDRKQAEDEIKRLRGIIPLCSFCKKIRDDKGYWKQVDIYIQTHSEADISHSICPECAEKNYPQELASRDANPSDE